MIEEIKESVKRMTTDDCKDVQKTMRLCKYSKAYILKIARANEDVAEYVLQY